MKIKKTPSIIKRCIVITLLTTSIIACNSSRKTENRQNNGQNFAQGNMPPGPPPGENGQNGMPPGPPPEGGNGQGMPPGPPPGGGMHNPFDTNLIKGTEIFTSDKATKSNSKIEADKENESAVVAFKNTEVILSSNQIITSGNTSSNDYSSFQGLNAAVLGRDESVIKMDHNKITTTGTGANAIFAYGKSTIYSENDFIDCTARGGHGIMASGGGTIHAKNISMITRGANSGVIATDRGSGTITVDKAMVRAEGQDSPGIYSTGKITVSDADITATGAEIAVIEGSNSIVCNNCKMNYSFQNKWGVMIYQSFSGDAEGVDGHYEMNNGSLKSEDKTGPLFFVTNSNANIFLNHVAIENASGILLNASANRWGRSGTNGGNAHITATDQSLAGEIIGDSISSVYVNLKEKSGLNGCINHQHKAKYIEVTIDKSSNWSLTQDSYVDKIDCTISNNQITNIAGNGHNLYYSKDDNPNLKGKTYLLENKGKLLPL